MCGFMINKLERKFGRFAIKGLMKYVTVLYIAGYIISLISPTFYGEYLMLDIDKLLRGQVWRIITFIIQPIDTNNLLLVAISLYVYYMLGNILEKTWGSFKFNLFYFSGILFNAIAVVIIYVIFRLKFGFGLSYPISLEYLNLSLFLAFAATFPNMQFLLMFILPIKAKILGFAYAVILAYDVFDAFYNGGEMLGIIVLVCVLVSMLNFVIFFLMTRKNRLAMKADPLWQQLRRAHAEAAKREEAIRRSGREAGSNGNVVYPFGNNKVTRHKCCICGRTEKDDPDLEFRFCSKCNGNYEYCSDHIYTHEHKQ